MLVVNWVVFCLSVWALLDSYGGCTLLRSMTVCSKAITSGLVNGCGLSPALLPLLKGSHIISFVAQNSSDLGSTPTSIGGLGECPRKIKT